MKVTTILVLFGVGALVGTADASRRRRRKYTKPCKGKIEAMTKLASEGEFTQAVKFQLADETLSRKARLAQAKEITASMGCDAESTRAIFRYVSLPPRGG